MKKVEIGNHLRLYRIRRNLSQSDVAKVLNYSQQTIAKWENSHSSPDPISLCKLADLYQISLDDLLHHSVVLETSAPYYTKKDVVDEWINSLGFKTVFETFELDNSKLEQLSRQLISYIDFMIETINLLDSEP